MIRSALEHAVDELRAATHSAESTVEALASQQADLIKKSQRYEKAGTGGDDDASGAHSPTATAVLLWGSSSDAPYPLEEKSYQRKGKGGKQDKDVAGAAAAGATVSSLVGPWRQQEQRVSAYILGSRTRSTRRRMYDNDIYDSRRHTGGREKTFIGGTHFVCPSLLSGWGCGRV